MPKLQARILSLATIGGIVALIVWQFLPQPHIAQQHPLRYYLSLPVNWSPDRTWLIFVIIDGVNQGHFLWNVLRFQQARHRLPFIAGANDAGRGVVNISTVAERAQLPIRGLQGDRDSHLTALNVQWEIATARAAQQGHRNIGRIMLPNAPHAPFPDDVFNAMINMRTNKP